MSQKETLLYVLNQVPWNLGYAPCSRTFTMYLIKYIKNWNK
jgi:hypothetical protein